MADTAAHKRNNMGITNLIENAANRVVLHYKGVTMSTNVQHVCIVLSMIYSSLAYMIHMLPGCPAKSDL